MRCAVLVAVVCVGQALGRYVPVLVNAPSKLPRQDPIGSWIQSSDWFPIEVNVPDTISALGSGISSGWMNLSDAFGSWLQQIPWFNRITSQFRPRPYKYLVFVPVKGGGMDVLATMNNFVPEYP